MCTHVSISHNKHERSNAVVNTGQVAAIHTKPTCDRYKLWDFFNGKRVTVCWMLKDMLLELEGWFVIWECVSAKAAATGLGFEWSVCMFSSHIVCSSHTSSVCSYTRNQKSFEGENVCGFWTISEVFPPQNFGGVTVLPMYNMQEVASLKKFFPQNCSTLPIRKTFHSRNFLH